MKQYTDQAPAGAYYDAGRPAVVVRIVNDPVVVAESRRWSSGAAQNAA